MSSDNETLPPPELPSEPPPDLIAESIRETLRGAVETAGPELVLDTVRALVEAAMCNDRARGIKQLEAFLAAPKPAVKP